MKNLTLKEIRRLYWEEKTREACNVFSSSGDEKNEARNMYLAAVDYAGEELAVCDTDREKIRAIYEASRSM